MNKQNSMKIAVMALAATALSALLFTGCEEGGSGKGKSQGHSETNGTVVTWYDANGNPTNTTATTKTTTTISITPAPQPTNGPSTGPTPPPPGDDFSYKAPTRIHQYTGAWDQKDGQTI